MNGKVTSPQSSKVEFLITFFFVPRDRFTCLKLGKIVSHLPLKTRINRSRLTPVCSTFKFAAVFFLPQARMTKAGTKLLKDCGSHNGVRYLISKLTTRGFPRSFPLSDLSLRLLTIASRLEKHAVRISMAGINSSSSAFLSHSTKSVFEVGHIVFYW